MDAKQWLIRQECLLTTNYTQIFVSLLKACKVTVKGIECDNAAF